MVEVPGLVCIISLVVERVVEVPGFIVGFVGFVGLVGLVGLTGLTGLVVERIVGLTARVGGDRVRPPARPAVGGSSSTASGSALLGRSTALGSAVAARSAMLAPSATVCLTRHAGRGVYPP
jgi:hypothetical protein